MATFVEQGNATLGIGTDCLELGDNLSHPNPRLEPLNFNFSWLPITSVTQSCGTINMNCSETEINTPIIFKISQTPTTDHYIQAVHWDFGDGTTEFFGNYNALLSNSITNGDFENDSIGSVPAAWTKVISSGLTGETVAVDNTWAFTGNHSVELSLPANSTSSQTYCGISLTSPIVVEADQFISVFFTFNIPAAGSSSTVYGETQLIWTGGPSTTTGPFFDSSGIQYGKFMNQQVPANATEVQCSITIQAIANSDIAFTAYIDDIWMIISDAPIPDITHTYTVANFQNIVTAIAVDNYGNEYVVAHPNYLVS